MKYLVWNIRYGAVSIFLFQRMFIYNVSLSLSLSRVKVEILLDSYFSFG